jgi:ABC-2 type transport system permease protein
MNHSVEATLVGLAFRQLLSRRRVVFVVLFAALPALLSLLVRASDPDLALEPALVEMYASMLVPVILPLSALVFGTGVFGSELEDGTVTFVLGKPVARWRIVLTRIVAAGLMTALVVVPSALAGGLVLGRGLDASGVVVAFSVAVGVGGFVYCALFVALSLSTRRALLTGLAYVILWEGLLASAFSATRALSVRQYTLALADRLARTPPEVIQARLDASTALVMAVLLAGAATAYAVRRLRRLEISQAA